MNVFTGEVESGLFTNNQNGQLVRTFGQAKYQSSSSASGLEMVVFASLSDTRELLAMLKVDFDKKFSSAIQEFAHNGLY